MHLIHELFEKATEELEEAEEYCELALKLKDTKEQIAAKLYRLSEEEVAQADNLMAIIKDLCEEKKRDGHYVESDRIRCEVKQELYHELKADVRTVQAAYKM